MKKDAIICDIDGVLVDTSWIFDKTDDMTTDEKWDFFNRNANNSGNKTNLDLVMILDKLKYFAGYQILFVTTRSDIIYKPTLLMLKRLFVSNHFELYMRREGDLSPSYEVKQKILNDIREKYNIVCAIDDDRDNCEMFKNNGITTMQVV